MRILKWLGGMVLFLVLLIGIIIYVKQPHTPPIQNAEGNSIASLEQVELNGARQWVLIRGQDKSKPVLLFLHGGPGMPMMYLAHAFQRPLENDFVVVQWDRRGAGKSFNENVTPNEISVSQMLSDTKALTDHLRKRFGKKKIYLVGHSFGSYLGALFSAQYPELLHAYISVGQVVDPEKARVIQERFLREQALKKGSVKAIKQIENIGPAAYETWLFEFGGELRHSTSWWPLLWTGIQAPEYGLWDVGNVAKGSSFSSRHMKYDVIDGSIIENITELDVPVYFFTGRFDYTTPFELIQQFHDTLKTPQKQMVWFEDSAHFPFFEQPDRFAEAMRKIL